MEDTDSSNDVVTLDKSGEEIGDQPIMGLFKRLISNDSKENTVLTNSQIINILEREFSVNINELHELELDVYLGVLKKFLKHWPLWDEFDKVVNELKSKGDNDDINKLLETKYIDLKTYLKAMLDVAKPMAKEALNSINEKKKTKDVIMEIHCSRSQLNRLFYKRPIPELNYTILNTTGITPSKITVGVLPLQAILNWWCIEIRFDFKNFIFLRKTKHILKHLLVNMKLGKPKIDKIPLDLNFHMNKRSIYNSQVAKDEIIDTVHKINNLTADTSIKNIINIVLEMFLRDMQLAPEELTVPAIYRRKWSKYPYVRYLYTDVVSNIDDNDDKYDLQLQETIVPECEWSLRKVKPEATVQQIIPGRSTYIEVECKLCMLRFSGNNMDVNLVNHFTTYHVNEPNWKCINCDGEFPMADLCQNWWHHKC